MSAELQIEYISIAELKPWPKNARTHSRKQVRQIADSITTFGFTNPVLIDEGDTILAGHGRVEAAKLFDKQLQSHFERFARGRVAGFCRERAEQVDEGDTEFRGRGRRGRSEGRG